MRGRFLRRRLSLGTPRVTVRSHVPLGWKLGAAGFVVVIAVVAGMLLSRLVSSFGGPPPPDPSIARLVQDNAALRAERDRLAQATRAAEVAVTASGVTMERATVRELGEQIARLEADNARLKEDVAFFEAATADRTPAGRGASGIAIRRFQVVRDPGTAVARYRILLTQDSRATVDFSGTLQLVATLVQDGKEASVAFPRESASNASSTAQSDGSPVADPYRVTFRSYKRIDGTFELPADAVLRSVQVRILERGTVRAQQTVTVG